MAKATVRKTGAALTLFLLKNFWQIQAFWNLDVFPITLEVRQLDSKSVADH